MKQNYIIVNGVPSWEIDGLVILKYPPIIRAPMRIEEEQVDSRHGSVVTELGYDPYDRELEIGLVGSYDINRVISYFGLGGEVVFGNEFDRVYTVNITEQISFERLVRNRKATVVMHCQPFKYHASEQSTVLSADGFFMNYGNVSSSPLYHIYGSGTAAVALVVDNETVGSVTIDMSELDEIYIDTETLEAYTMDGENAVLRNSKCTGSYTALRTAVGLNEVDITGIEQIEITRKSRWV